MGVGTSTGGALDLAMTPRDAERFAHQAEADEDYDSSDSNYKDNSNESAGVDDTLRYDTGADATKLPDGQDKDEQEHPLPDKVPSDSRGTETEHEGSIWTTSH